MKIQGKPLEEWVDIIDEEAAVEFSKLIVEKQSLEGKYYKKIVGFSTEEDIVLYRFNKTKLQIEGVDDFARDAIYVDIPDSTSKHSMYVIYLDGNYNKYEHLENIMI